MDNTEITIDELVNQIKMKAGISIDEKDGLIKVIVNGVIDELINVNGIRDLDIQNFSDAMLVIDYAEWRYSSRGEGGYYEFRASNGEGANILPQHLAWRLKNRRLMVGRIKEVDNG